MKTSHIVSLLAVALAGAASLFSKSLEQETVRLRIDVDRVVLPADSTERAVVKIGLDCLRPPRRESHINATAFVDFARSA